MMMLAQRTTNNAGDCNEGKVKIKFSPFFGGNIIMALSPLPCCHGTRWKRISCRHIHE